MKVEQLAISEVLLIQPRVFSDSRGFFLESFNQRAFSEAGLPSAFVQDNRARSKKGTLRGLHYQLMRPQGKLVTVVRGEVFDVAVDIRRGSPTFGQSVGLRLCGDDPRLLWIPPGFAHGYCALSDEVDFLYKVTDFYDPVDEKGVLWSDSSIGIQWPIENPLLAERDKCFAPLDASRPDLPVYSHG